MQLRYLTALLPIFVISSLAIFSQVAAQSPGAGNEYFQRTWERTDTPVVTGSAVRTWMWGPAYTEESWETYADSPDGRRSVQYFDKSRMEISFPHSDNSSDWYVTNGLLVVEMVTGMMQFGDTAFEELSPAAVNVAGDSDDSSGPTYATFAELLDETEDQGTSLISEKIDREGIKSSFSGAAVQDIHLGHYDAVTQHNIAAPFWEFMNAEGLIVENGEFTTSSLFLDPFFATGRPISDPYWATVQLAGVPVDVLLQCFERRCLTYTPANAPEWRVEAGNVGLHYHIWRYGAPEYLLAWERDNEVWSMNATGTSPRSLSHDSIPGGATDSYPVWSPDGSQIAFVRSLDGETDIYLIGDDGADLQKLTTGDSAAPYWSPDGSEIAFRSPNDNVIFVKDISGPVQRQITTGPGFDTVNGWSQDGQRLLIERKASEEGSAGSEIIVASISGGEPDFLTPDDSSARMPSWSPNESKIAYMSTLSGSTNIWVMNANGSNPHQLSATNDPSSHPSWSPDGSMIVYVEESAGGSNIWVMAADGEDPVVLTTAGSSDSQPVWSNDGSKIYFMSDRDGQNDLYVMDADGSHIHRLTSDPANDRNPALSAQVDQAL